MRRVVKLWRKVRYWKVSVAIEETTREFLGDNCTHLAASLSYYFLFSLFPLTLVAVSVMGFLLASPQVEANVIAAIKGFLPVAGDTIGNIIKGVVGARGAMGALAIVGLLWAGSSFFNGVRKSLNTAWGVRQPRSYWKERLMELVMMIGAGLMLLASLALTSGLKVLRELYYFETGFFRNDWLWTAIWALLATALTFITFLCLYRWIPNTRVRWRDVWAGALTAAVSFEVVKQFFLWVIGATRYGYIYGTIGAIVALLMWCYVSALIFLYCAKLSTVYPRVAARYAQQPMPPEEAKPVARRPSLLSPSSILLAMLTITTIGLDLMRRLVARKP